MTKEEFAKKLKLTMEEVLLNQIDVINGDEKEDGDEQMFVAIFQIFQTVLDNQQFLESLYNTGMTYDEVKKAVQDEYKRQN